MTMQCNARPQMTSRAFAWEQIRKHGAFTIRLRCVMIYVSRSRESGINPSVMRLKLPLSLNIHPTFHVSLLNPVSHNTLDPLAEPPLPTWLIDGHPVFTACRQAVDASIWLTRRGLWPRGVLLGEQTSHLGLFFAGRLVEEAPIEAEGQRVRLWGLL